MLQKPWHAKAFCYLGNHGRGRRLLGGIFSSLATFLGKMAKSVAGLPGACCNTYHAILKNGKKRGRYLNNFERTYHAILENAKKRGKPSRFMRQHLPRKFVKREKTWQVHGAQASAHTTQFRKMPKNVVFMPGHTLSPATFLAESPICGVGRPIAPFSADRQCRFSISQYLCSGEFVRDGAQM